MILYHDTKEDKLTSKSLLKFSFSIPELQKTRQRLREISNSLPKQNTNRKH